MSSDDQAATFCAITGLEDPSQAAMYLEMAGGNLEMAMSIYFDGGASQPPEAAPSGFERPDWFRAVWPGSVTSYESIPESWMLQTLEFEDVSCPGCVSSSIGRVGLNQPKNGPCGLIAAIQAACIAELCRVGAEPGKLDVTDEILASVLSAMLWQAKLDDDHDVKLVFSATREGGLDVTTFTDIHSLQKAVLANIGVFKRGVTLFVYSLVMTRTVEGVRSDVMMGGGDLPLVTDLFLCTSELVSLCLRGNANGNVGAFQPIADDTGENIRLEWPEGLGVGLLSMDEYQTKIPVADALKSPKFPVWILHGGDHFTVLWAADLKAPRFDEACSSGDGVSFSLLHWNGLPPNGPRLAYLNVLAREQAAPAPKRRKTPVQFEPLIGEVESIVQADPEMKKTKPNGWTTWRFEVQLAGLMTKEEGVLYDPRPEGARLPETFDPKDHPAAGEENGKWRCAACYSTRFKTMCFGMNELRHDDDDPTCENCGRPQRVGGHTIWLTYDQLPSSWQRRADRQFAPKILSVLRTKWPGCHVDMVGDAKFGVGNWPSV